MNQKNRNIIAGISIVCALVLTGCSIVSAFAPTETPTETPLPTNTAIPTQTPTATPIPFYLSAKVWNEQLMAPILIYHQFVPDDMNTDATQMRFSDFRAELQEFYDNGYSLIPLKGWLEGNFDLPAGKKPLVITMDDLWFGNQIYINDDGTPSIFSGIGILWAFSQEHPDFGFSAALFAINGDKYYPEKQVGNRFYAADNIDFYSKSWHIKLGNTIAWALDNGLEVYSHTFTHPPNWSTIPNADIQKQLDNNDYWLRVFLQEAGREDLIPKLDNMIALPEGKWPELDSGKKVVLNYRNPEEKPVQAVMEAYNMDSAQLTPSAFSEGFDPFHIVRITASAYMTQFIINQKENVPTVDECQIGPIDESQSGDLAVIQSAIEQAVLNQTCPQGVYNVAGNLFLARNGVVERIRSATVDPSENELLPTPTATP